MSMAQIIFNNTILALFFVYLGWTNLKPHLVANKIIKDEKAIDELLKLKRNVDLQNSLKLIPNFRGYTPVVLLDDAKQTIVKDTLKNLGYRTSVSVALVLFYFAQQDLARFRYMVTNGYSYKDQSILTFSFNVKRVMTFTALTVIFFIAISQAILHSVN